MERDPRDYSRLLVLAVLVPMLLLDLVVGLPERAFVGIGVPVLLVAAGVHLYGDEHRAAGGWLSLAASLALFASADVPGETLPLVAFLGMLVAGLVLLASQRSAGTE